VTFTLPEPGTANPDFARPADAERLEHTAEALRQRGFQVTIAESGDQARQLVLDALPEGAEVHTGLSETLQQIGLTDVLENSGRYDSVRPCLKQLDRETQGREMRKLGAAPDYVIGSAAAITDDGQIVVGSGSGSQLGAYAYAGRARDSGGGPPETGARRCRRPGAAAALPPAARVGAHAGRWLPGHGAGKDADHLVRARGANQRDPGTRDARVLDGRPAPGELPSLTTSRR
jgi:hypothetical protein